MRKTMNNNISALVVAVAWGASSVSTVVASSSLLSSDHSQHLFVRLLPAIQWVERLLFITCERLRERLCLDHTTGIVVIVII